MSMLHDASIVEIHPHRSHPKDSICDGGKTCCEKQRVKLAKQIPIDANWALCSKQSGELCNVHQCAMQMHVRRKRESCAALES